jgi:hypothetical protein
VRERVGILEDELERAWEETRELREINERRAE